MMKEFLLGYIVGYIGVALLLYYLTTTVILTP